MAFNEKLREAMSRKRLKAVDLARETGLSEAIISEYLSGKKEPRGKQSVVLAKTLSISLDELWETAMPSKTVDDAYRPYRVPVLGSVPAGVPIEAIEDITGYEEINPMMLNGGKEYFALRVSGHSMEPEYRNGDIVIIRKQDDAEDGSDVVAMVNGDDATFKRLRKDENGIKLCPRNSDYDTLVFTNKQIEELPVRILGVCVEMRRSVGSSNLTKHSSTASQPSTLKTPSKEARHNPNSIKKVVWSDELLAVTICLAAFFATLILFAYDCTMPIVYTMVYLGAVIASWRGMGSASVIARVALGLWVTTLFVVFNTFSLLPLLCMWLCVVDKRSLSVV